MQATRPLAQRTRTLLLAGHGLSVDRTTAEAVTALRAAGLRPLLLKGPAVARWLYGPDEVRAYSDTDLLVALSALDRAGEALRGIGFAMRHDERSLAVEEAHAQSWKRDTDGRAIDLHWRLPGCACPPERAFSLLAGRTEEIEVAGVPIDVLDVPGRAMHLALHAAANGRQAAKSMDDLARGLERLARQVWQAAAELAWELEAMSPFVAGLGLQAAGAALARDLDLPANTSLLWALYANGPPASVKLARILEAPGVAERAKVLARALSPPSAFMLLHPLCEEGGSRAILAARRRRMLKGLRWALPAAAAVWREGRAIRRSARRA